MAVVCERVITRTGKSAAVGRISEVLHSFSLETLLDLEDRLIYEQECLASRRRCLATLNLTILEVALLTSFRRLPDDQRRGDVVNAIAGFVASGS